MSGKFLEGRLALVTGASRGIGAASALAFAKAGAHVILTARTDGGLEETEAAIHAAGGTATIAPMDLTDQEQIARLAQAINARWGKLDILLLNAATLGEMMPVTHIPAKHFQETFAINTFAPWHMLCALDSALRAADKGRVLALTSSVATNPRPYWGAYAASKAALENLLDIYALEVANITAIRTAIIDPGGTRTAMRAKAYPGENPESLKTPDSVAQAIVDLLAKDFETRHHLLIR